MNLRTCLHVLLAATAAFLCSCMAQRARLPSESTGVPEEHGAAVAAVSMDHPEALDAVEAVLDDAGIDHDSFGSLTWTVVVHEGRAWEALARLKDSDTTKPYTASASQLVDTFRTLATMRARYGIK